MMGALAPQDQEAIPDGGGHLLASSFETHKGQDAS